MIRPGKVNEFIGNPSAREQIQLVLDTVRKTGETYPHSIFFGPPGTGKTTLAGIVANELNAPLVSITGSTISNQEDLFCLLKDLFEGPREPGQTGAPILFIDEIAALTKPKDLDQTIWLPILEDFKFYTKLKGKTVVWDGRNWLIEQTGMNLPPFTCIGATTNIADLEPALVRRFPVQIFMKPYTIEELTVIIEQAADRNKMTITTEAAEAIARRSRYTPATAMTFLRHCWWWKSAKDLPTIDMNTVSQTMTMLGVDSFGLKYEDLKILNALGNNNKGLGLSNLAGVSGIQKDVIERIVEPFLKEMGLMAVTSKRIITDKGLDYITRPEVTYG